MIYPQTILTVADNTGAKKVMCIQVLGGNKKYAKVGDIIIAVVKEMYIRFDDNAAVIVNMDNNPKGTRVFGPVAREIRDKNYSKIVSLAPEVL